MTGWQQWLPAIIATLITTVGGGLFAVWVKRMNRRLDTATAVAQEATAQKSQAESRKAEAETASVVVATAHSLIAEIKAAMADQRANYETRLAEQAARSEKNLGEAMARHDEDMRRVSQRVTTVEEREQQLRSALVEHAPWDRQVWERVRNELDPDWPPPPPLDFD